MVALLVQPHFRDISANFWYYFIYDIRGATTHEANRKSAIYCPKTDPARSPRVRDISHQTARQRAGTRMYYMLAVQKHKMRFVIAGI